jgi:uncharacterized membrane protein
MMPALFASLRLEGLAGGWFWPWLALIAGGGAFLFWTYRGIYRRSGRKLAWGLLALRCLGLLLLAMMLAKPTWTQAKDEVEPARVAIVLDTSRSMSLADASGSSRYARAVAAVESLTKKLTAPTKDGRLEVDLFDIAGKPLKKRPEKPTADFTDLTKGLRSTLAQSRSRPLAGLILISDGVDTSGRANFLDWEDAGVPIHTIGFPRGIDFDLAVREPTAQKRVIVGNDMTIEVPVHKTGQAAVEATVSLKRGGVVLKEQKVKLDEGDVEQVVKMTYRPEQPGSFELTASVEAVAGEKDVSNNAVNFPLEVDNIPIHILYIEGFLRDEYTFLTRHFPERDPDVTIIKEPRRSSTDDGPDKTLPEGVLTDKTLEKIDIVILGDLEGDYLTAAHYKALLKWLDGKNHSLLVLGGYESFGARGFRNTPLNDALPVVFAAGDSPQSEKPFTLRLTDKGQSHPIFALSADRVQNAKLWKESIPLDGMPLVARARPGADVLATNPEVIVDGKPAVALAVQRAGGGGQVMVFCPDTTWKWSRYPRLLGQEDLLYGKFWSQTVRWLAGRATDDSRPLLSVRTGQPTSEVNRKVTVKVVRQRRPGTDLTGSQYVVDIRDPKGAAVPGLVPRVDSTDPDVATVEFYPTKSGRYAIDAAIKAEGKVLANQGSEVMVRGADLELADTGTRPDNLKALAKVTGGTYEEIDKADEIADRIPRSQRRTLKVNRTEFWDSPWLFAAFLGAISGEWFLRRRNHLV